MPTRFSLYTHSEKVHINSHLHLYFYFLIYILRQMKMKFVCWMFEPKTDSKCWNDCVQVMYNQTSCIFFIIINGNWEILKFIFIVTFLGAFLNVFIRDLRCCALVPIFFLSFTKPLKPWQVNWWTIVSFLLTQIIPWLGKACSDHSYLNKCSLRWLMNSMMCGDDALCLSFQLCSSFFAHNLLLNATKCYGKCSVLCPCTLH